jgi:hypothetical protein
MMRKCAWCCCRHNLQKVLKERYRTTKFIPFNPVDKFTCATVLDTQTNQSIRLLKGSPQVGVKTWGFEFQIVLMKFTSCVGHLDQPEHLPAQGVTPGEVTPSKNEKGVGNSGQTLRAVVQKGISSRHRGGPVNGPSLRAWP